MAMQQVVVQSWLGCSTFAAGGLNRGPAELRGASPAAGPGRASEGIGRTRRGGANLVVRAGGRRNTPGEKESKAAYDAFFLGKSLAEVVNERVGSAIGEFLSDVGRRQAEQQKKIRQFQDEVKERAATTAVKAAQKAVAEERAKERAKPSTTSPPPKSPPPTQPPPSTSGLSSPRGPTTY